MSLADFWLVAQMKALEAENTRLKKMVADRDLELEVMKEINAKKW
jgi:putative transposase